MSLPFQPVVEIPHEHADEVRGGPGVCLAVGELEVWMTLGSRQEVGIELKESRSHVDHSDGERYDDGDN